MATYVVFDVEIHDAARFAEFMQGVKPAIEAVGARYLARGSARHALRSVTGSRGASCCWSSPAQWPGRRFTTARCTKG